MLRPRVLLLLCLTSTAQPPDSTPLDSAAASEGYKGRGADEAAAQEARRAVAAARATRDAGVWPATPVAERAALLRRIADLLIRDREALARLETVDTGKTLAESRIDIDDVVSVFRY